MLTGVEHDLSHTVLAALARIGVAKQDGVGDSSEMLEQLIRSQHVHTRLGLECDGQVDFLADQ